MFMTKEMLEIQFENRNLKTQVYALRSMNTSLNLKLKKATQELNAKVVKEVKEVENKYKKEIRNLKKENESLSLNKQRETSANHRDLSKGLYKDYQELLMKYEKEIKERKEDKELIKTLTKAVENLTTTIEELKKEILRLKKNNGKDSSNSSKPSSTNGYKKVITNTRPKSNNQKGKPKGSKSTNLSQEKLNTFLNSGNVVYEIKEINKNRKNKNQNPLIFNIMDITIQKLCTELRTSPNTDGTYDIPAYLNRPIQYGNTIKTICTFMNNDIYNSTDGISRFINHITNGGINLSKSTLLTWNKVLKNNLLSEIEKIEESLLNSYYINGDDSTIKIDGDNYYDLCTCNNTHTRLYISDKKNSKAWKDKTILKDYKGIIVKDGTDVFNDMGIDLAQCASHIERYIKGIYDFVDHKGAIKMSNFIKKCIHTRKELIHQNIGAFTQEEISNFMSEFNEIFREWKKEWMNSNPLNNAVYDDERRLLARFEDEKEREQILYFIKDFNVPTTNSQAEVDQRGLKIKQKIGKFRSTESADDYAVIRSCILTYKKQGINVMDAILSAFNGNPVII